MKQKLLTALMHLLARLPWGLLHWLGRRIGGLMYRLNGREAWNARANLQIAYPQLDQAARERLVRQALVESAVTFTEMPRIWLSREDLAERVDPNGLPEAMARLAGQGHGLILAMPHHGNWEMVSSGIDQRLKITGLYRPPRQAFIEPIMTQGRTIARINMVPTSRAGIKALHDTLKAGDVVAILPDQVPKQAGAAAMMAPFFGREAPTMVLLGRLAAKHGAPVLFVWAERQGDGRYRMQWFEADEAIRARDAAESARALNRSIEQVIAAQPAQYQWAYRRYTALPGEPGPYSRG